MALAAASNRTMPFRKNHSLSAALTGAYMKLVWVAGQLERDLIFIFH
jgi:hypothetical protein